MHIFFEVHEGLPREAPGDEQSTLRALTLMKGLPAHPSILDIGCGPGAQTIALTLHSAAEIAAIDIHRPFLLELSRRAATAGVSSRVHLVCASMMQLPFRERFDVIWSEGAVYFMGFEQGLRAWRRLLKPHGYVAVTELSWIKPDPPSEIVEYWHAEYPGMRTVANNLSSLRAAGYREVGHFILPESAWWEPYYAPMEARIALLRHKYRSDPESLQLLGTRALEIEMYRRYSEWYGYAFYVMQI